MHQRRIAPFYRFDYDLTYLLVDIDQLAEVDRDLKWFSHNRFNLMAFHDGDHGPKLASQSAADRGPGLRAWAERVMMSCGIEPPKGSIRLLTLPRLFGHVFNPISVWYCDDEAGTLAAVIIEVNNTFGERHSYVMARSTDDQVMPVVHHKAKNFHVSPLLDRHGHYRFMLQTPGRQLRLVINLSRDDGAVLDAVLAGEWRPLNDAEIVATLLSMPMMTLKVVCAIHWQALRIWLRGAKYFPKPPPPEAESS
jgi:DUF1365 family protein